MQNIDKKGQAEIYQILDELNIDYKYYESPKDFDTEDDQNFWKRCGATRCKNLFLRNHKGNKHFLIIAPFYEKVSIYNLEQHFKKGKISFASDVRLEKHLALKAGAVSLFGLINDKIQHVEVFLDERLRKSKTLSFLANIKGVMITLSFDSTIKLINHFGNTYHFFDFEEDIE
ncbi:MAG: prolyl-tRNA synthetase associated domain-containing protein [Bacteroidales bacterium]|nr:prolyl-tRNA synthetase associated domain-containing protein [Bacteroidales bacterium]